MIPKLKLKLKLKLKPFRRTTKRKKIMYVPGQKQAMDDDDFPSDPEEMDDEMDDDDFPSDDEEFLPEPVFRRDIYEAVSTSDVGALRQLIQDAETDQDKNEIVGKALYELAGCTAVLKSGTLARTLVEDLEQRQVTDLIPPDLFWPDLLGYMNLDVMEVVLSTPRVNRGGIKLEYIFGGYDEEIKPRAFQLLLNDEHGYDINVDPTRDAAVRRALEMYSINTDPSNQYAVLMFLRDERVRNAVDLNDALKTAVTLGIPIIVDDLLKIGPPRVDVHSVLDRKILKHVEVLEVFRQHGVDAYQECWLGDGQWIEYAKLVMSATHPRYSTLLGLMVRERPPWFLVYVAREAAKPVYDVGAIDRLLGAHEIFQERWKFQHILLHTMTQHVRPDIVDALFQRLLRDTPGAGAPSAAKEIATQAELGLAYAHALYFFRGQPDLGELRNVLLHYGMSLSDYESAQDTYTNPIEVVIDALSRKDFERAQRLRWLWGHYPWGISYKYVFPLLIQNENWEAIMFVIKDNDFALPGSNYLWEYILEHLNEDDQYHVVRNLALVDFPAVLKLLQATEDCELKPRAFRLMRDMLHFRWVYPNLQRNVSIGADMLPNISQYMAYLPHDNGCNICDDGC
jgi:hypothetical protein